MLKCFGVPDARYETRLHFTFNQVLLTRQGRYLCRIFLVLNTFGLRYC